MDLKDKRVVVVGLGRSGVAAARLCQARGANVLGVDSGSPAAAAELSARGIAIQCNDGEARAAASADLVVVSPGVPRLSVFDECAGRGIEVIGELELGSRFATAPIVAVGGTNGKSTTTKLCGDIFAAAGRRAFVGGNYGIPVCEAVGSRFDVLVLEVSSFQLERAPSFHPRVSILLNVSEDHLDRYPDFHAYALAKGNAFVRQTSNDYAVVPAGDVVCEAQAARGQGRSVRYGPASALAGLDYALAGSTLSETASRTRWELGGTALCGTHNFYNAAAAIAAGRALGVDAEPVLHALSAFEPLPHRMARVTTRAGVTYYDDSKGTNVGAAVTALRGLSEARAVLLAGGRDKQGSYAPLVAALSERGRALVVLGEAAEAIARAAEGALPVHRAASMAEAVSLAAELATPGDAVLLSPACSSFDMYTSYTERGDDFQRCVNALPAP